MCAWSKNGIRGVGIHQTEKRQSCLVFIGEVKQVDFRQSPELSHNK